MNPQAMLSARSLAAEIDAGRLSPSQALAFPAAAIEAAEERLCIFSQRNQSLKVGRGPLSGIAIGVKDIFDTFDMPTGYGSRLYATHQPVSDAGLVTMLRRAGATFAGKTVTTEFAWFSPGRTRNPHNPAYTPGGSSSGSAAGVAAGYFPAAIGSQTGGSIIRPAAFCGVSGYKPSFRLFPTTGMKQFSWSLDTVGFFAASAADNAFIAHACSGRDLLIDDSNDSPPRFGVYKSLIDDQMSDEMATALRLIARRVRQWGGKTTSVRGPMTVENGREAHSTIQGYEASLALGDEFARNPGKLTKKLRDYLRECQTIGPDAYDNARRTSNRARKACHALFENCDVLLLPSAPGTAPRTLKSTGDSIFNRLWTLMGLPCVNVNVGTGENGLPIGVQVVAPFGRDKRALQAAHWLETQLARGH